MSETYKWRLTSVQWFQWNHIFHLNCLEPFIELTLYEYLLDVYYISYISDEKKFKSLKTSSIRDSLWLIVVTISTNMIRMRTRFYVIRIVWTSCSKLPNASLSQTLLTFRKGCTGLTIQKTRNQEGIIEPKKKTHLPNIYQSQWTVFITTKTKTKNNPKHMKPSFLRLDKDPTTTTGIYKLEKTHVEKDFVPS